MGQKPRKIAEMVFNLGDLHDLRMALVMVRYDPYSQGEEFCTDCPMGCSIFASIWLMNSWKNKGQCDEKHENLQVPGKLPEVSSSS